VFFIKKTAIIYNFFKRFQLYFSLAHSWIWFRFVKKNPIKKYYY